MSGDLAGYLQPDADRRPALRRGFAQPGAQPQSLRSDHLQLSDRTSRSGRWRWSIPMTGLDKSHKDRRSPSSQSSASKPSCRSTRPTASERSRGSITARTPISTRRACSIRSSASRSSAPTMSSTIIRSLLERVADQPAAVQCRAAARRADHRRPGDLHRAEARRPAGPAGRRAGRCRRADRGRRFLGARAGRRRPTTRSRRWPRPSTG